MVGALLWRGMLVGVLVGLLLFGFARVFGEPQVDRAIAFEALQDQREEAAAMAHGQHPAPEPELVSRRMQASLGLLMTLMGLLILLCWLPLASHVPHHEQPV